MTIDTNKEYIAVIDTSAGKITVRLFAKEAPMTVNNFVFLAREGFYNGVKIHRVVKDFMFQTGDPRGDGRGGPGYTFPDEKIVRDYTPGIVAMANSGPNTNGSQFFIMLGDWSNKLPKNYVIFGEVTGGYDVALTIGRTPVTLQEPGGENSKPTTDLRVNSISIQEK
jgi:cyclophilin family peptidyl-prolyl cis-trans isomerase